MPRYDRVRFIGYAVPTTPADIVPVGDPNGAGNVAGTYRAAPDLEADVYGRAQTLKAAVDTARAALPTGDGVLNVFLAPEFYWHGPMGPYVHGPGDPDPADVILDELQKHFPVDEYPDFLLVLGTAISAEVADLGAVMRQSSTIVSNDVVRALGEGWQQADGPLAVVVFDALVNFIKNCHAYAQVEVRNRAFILGPAEFDGVEVGLGVRAITTEKYFVSNEDLLLGCHGQARHYRTDERLPDPGHVRRRLQVRAARPVRHLPGGRVGSGHGRCGDLSGPLRSPDAQERRPQSVARPGRRAGPASDPLVRHATASAVGRRARRGMGVQLRRSVRPRGSEPSTPSKHERENLYIYDHVFER
ncbi:hypothetical protein [Gordonia iterans]